MILDKWPEQIKKGINLVHKERNINTVQDPFFVWEDKIPEYLRDKETISYINMYARTKRWGLPFGGGWANNPKWIIDILDILSEMEIKYGKRKT